MHVTCMDYCLYCMEYACSMHGIWHISCIFHAWYWFFPCMVQANSMHDTSVFHAWYRGIPCVVQAYSMRGTCIFHAQYRYIPCVVQVYSMRGTGVFTVHGTGIPMHALCTVRAYSQHIISILIDFVFAYRTYKVQRQICIIDTGTVTRKWTRLVGRIGCKDRQLLHTYYLYT